VNSARSKRSADIAELGHVGLFTDNLDAAVAFYRDVIGLVVTDQDDEAGMVFLSARPGLEHHELLLCRGRDAGPHVNLVQQISFRCYSLDALKSVYARVVASGVPIDMVVSHGNALGVYFRDPENNRLEVYWQTGLEARQPFLIPVDLTRPAAELMQDVATQVAQYGQTGYVDRRLLKDMDIP
jgi:catechol-2,3-dioxygenase